MNVTQETRDTKKGFTLIETTTVITLILALISVAIVGINAYMGGSNRARCILNIHAVQTAVRVHGNINEIPQGENHPGLKNEIIGEGRLIKTIPACPAAGIYTTLEDHMPIAGEPYIQCTLSDSSSHIPRDYTGW